MVQPTRKSRLKVRDKGDYKLVVYFINHRDIRGRPKTFHSNRSQDRRGLSVNRFKKMVSGEIPVRGESWADKVNWAGIYYCPGTNFGEKVAEFKEGQWE